MAEEFRCPRCGHVSAARLDIRWGWCGQCQDYTRGERVEPARRERPAKG